MFRARLLLRLWFASFLFLVFQGPAAADPILVDDFSEAFSVLSLVSNPDPSIVTVGVDSGLNVLGGKRTTLIATTGQATPGFDSTILTFFPSSPGFMDGNSQVGWEGTISLSYDLSGLPSVLDGAVGLEIAFLGYDGPGGNPMAVTANLDPPGGGPGTDGPTAFAVGGAQVLEVLFPDGVPLDDIATLRVSFSLPTGSDFRLDSIYTVVPEPSTLLLLAGGLVGVGWAGRGTGARRPRTRARSC